MKDVFEKHKGNVTYPLAAEIKVINGQPVFTWDKFSLFDSPFFNDDKLFFPCVGRDNLTFNFFRATMFNNNVPFEEHIFSKPSPGRHNEFWWSHPYILEMINSLSIKFYGCR